MVKTDDNLATTRCNTHHKRSHNKAWSTVGGRGWSLLFCRVGGRGRGRIKDDVFLSWRCPRSPGKNSWVALAVWPPRRCDCEKYDRHTHWTCTTRSVMARLYTGWTLGGVAIRRALPQNLTTVYAEKGCHRIEKCDDKTLHKWDSVGSGNCNVWSVRTTGF